MEITTRMRPALGAAALAAAALLATGCPPPLWDDRELACDDYCDGLLACDEGWEIGIDAASCDGVCYEHTTAGEMECVADANGCDDVRRCLCYPLYAYLYEGCHMYFSDAAGHDLYLEDVVWMCEEDDPDFGFGAPINDCLVYEASCAGIDACLDDL